ncbi:MAG: hypothetical protein II205_04150 [Bacteroidales bacterium]|nr:hypothetical protein [Bacteroidales bacterium]
MVIAGLGAALSLGSSIYGAIKSGKQNKEARQMLQDRRDENRKWYESRMAEDYTSRADAQAVFNKQRELLEERYNQARATRAVSGDTAESEAMQKAAANDAVAQSMSDVAAAAEQHKENVEQQYRQTDAALAQAQAESKAAQAQATAQAASQAAAAGLNLLGSSLNNADSGAADAVGAKPKQDENDKKFAQSLKDAADASMRQTGSIYNIPKPKKIKA